MRARRVTVLVLACLTFLAGQKSSSHPAQFRAGALFLAPSPPPAAALPEGALARLGPNRPQKKDAVEAIAFSPDGKTLVSAHKDHTLRLWDVAKGVERARFPGLGKDVLSLAFAPDGKAVLAAWSTGAALWTIPVGECKAKLAAKDCHLHYAAFTRDGRALAWLEDKRHVLHLWDVSTGRLVREFAGHTGSVVSIALAPDGKRFASSGKDRGARLWDLTAGKEVRRLDWAQEQPFGEKKRYLARQLLFTPNGWTLYATGELGSYCLWDMTAGGEMVTSHVGREDRGEMRDGSRKVAITGDRVLAFTADSQVLVFASNGPFPHVGHHEVATFSQIGGGPSGGHTGDVTALVFAPGDRVLATGSSDGTILLWDVREAQWARRVPPLLNQKSREYLWAALAADLRDKVYNARWQLVQASDQGVALIEEKVRRARDVPAKQVRKLAAGLDDDGPEVRRKAFEQLKALGPEAEPALRAALRDRPSAELSHKAELLQKAWSQPQPAQALLILEQINTARARAALMDLAAGKAGARRTREALAALHRMKGRPVAAPLERPKIEFLAAGLATEATSWPRGPGKPPSPGTDLSGNPLPKGAIARIGTPKAIDDKHIAPGAVRAQACLSPNGKALLTLRGDGVVRFWETATGRPLRSLRLKGVSLSLMVLTPDGLAIACAGRDQQLRPILALLDAENGAVLWSARLPGRDVSFLAVSGDGKAVAWAADDAVHLWGSKTGRELRRFVGHKDTVQLGAFSPDGKLLVTAVDDDVRVWEVRTGREVRRLNGHGGHAVLAVAFAPDGKTLASVGGDDFLALWDATSWQRARRIPVASGWQTYLAFSSDGKVVAGGETSRTLSLWDAGTGKLKHRLGGHVGTIRDAIFARDGKALVSVSEDRTALVWKWPSAVAAEVGQPKPGPTDVLGNPLPPGALVRMGALWLRHEDTAVAAAVSPDGKRLAVAVAGNHGPAIYLWDVATGKELRRFGEGLWLGPRIAFSPDGKLLATAANQTIYLWAPATGERVQQFIGHPNTVTSFAFSPDGKTLAVGGGGDREGTEYDVRLFDLATGRERARLAAHRTAVGQLVFAADGRALFSLADELCVWSPATGKLLRRLNAPGPWPVLAPDGRTLICEETKTRLALIDLASGKTLARLGGTAGAGGLFSPGGKRFAVADGKSRLCLWGLPGGRKLRELQGASQEAHPFCFSPDGKRLVIASGGRGRWRSFFGDSGLRLWDVGTDTEVRPVAGHRDAVTCLAFAPDMRTLVSGSSDKTLRVWETKTGRELRTLGKPGHPLTALAFAPNGRTLAAADAGGTLLLCDPASGKQRARVEGHAEGIRSLAFTPDGKALVAVTGKGEVVVRDAATAKELRRHDVREDRGTALATSPDGTVVVSVLGREVFDGPGGPLLFWDRATDRVLAKREGENNEVFQGATFSPDGRMVVLRGGINNRFNSSRFRPHLRLIEVATGREVLRLNKGEGPLAFSPDGRILAVGDALWDLATGKEAGRLKGHRGAVESLAFSPDGARLASGSADTTALVWQRSALFAAGRPPGGPLPLAALWADLAGADAARAHTAAWRLATGPDRAVPFLDKKLKPVSRPDAARLARLVADLDSDTFAVREQAQMALEEQGELAEAALRAVLRAKPSVETYRRVKRLLEKIEARLASPRWLQTMRAIAVLERIGTKEAQVVLEKLARGAGGAWPTREAKASLQRLSRRAAPEGKTD